MVSETPARPIFTNFSALIGLEKLVLDEPDLAHSSFAQLPLDEILAEDHLSRSDRIGVRLGIRIGRKRVTRIGRVAIGHGERVDAAPIFARLALWSLAFVGSR